MNKQPKLNLWIPTCINFYNLPTVLAEQFRHSANDVMNTDCLIPIRETEKEKIRAEILGLPVPHSDTLSTPHIEPIHHRYPDNVVSLF